MKLLRWNALDAAARSLALQRPTQAGSDRVDASVAAIIDQVRAGGDASIRELTRRLDGVQLELPRVDEAEFADALAGLAPELLEAMIQARERLIAWHRAGTPGEFEIETAPGVRCGRILRGIGRVGLYVPAGSAPLPSTALMLGVPAALAACAEVVVCTPPRADGKADPAVLAACSLCGISTVFKIGGAQAIAALAFGTETVPACDKIFGPGNAYVTAAKQQVSTMPGGAAIDMPAGPSEVLVVADDGASPAFVAADLLSQAEHGPDSQVILVSNSERLLSAVANEVEAQVICLPRAAIARASLEHARLILVKGMDSAIAISNDYAPEHLILALRDPESWLPSIRVAGSVFLGDHAPESLGDYCSGTNHVLPTNGAARAFSGISVSSFQVAISTQSVSRAGLAGIGPCAVTMARAEGLEAHARSILVRLGEPA